MPGAVPLGFLEPVGFLEGEPIFNLGGDETIGPTPVTEPTPAPEPSTRKSHFKVASLRPHRLAVAQPSTANLQVNPPILSTAGCALDNSS